MHQQGGEQVGVGGALQVLCSRCGRSPDGASYEMKPTVFRTVASNMIDHMRQSAAGRLEVIWVICLVLICVSCRHVWRHMGDSGEGFPSTQRRSTDACMRVGSSRRRRLEIAAGGEKERSPDSRDNQLWRN